MVVMTSAASTAQRIENPYHDRIEGGILVYTGAGREGHQSLAGVNNRIPTQVDQRFPIYGFQKVASRRDQSVGAKRWRFLGLLEYLRHYPENQLDVRNDLRRVWLFELCVHSHLAEVPVALDQRLALEAVSERQATVPDDLNDRAVAEICPPTDRIAERTDALEVEGERSRLLSLTPRDFEHIVRDVLSSTGFEHVRVTRYSQDGGIDVEAIADSRMWPIRGLFLQIQAKRWLHTVGRKEIAELRGSLQPFARGAVVTTSHFSRAAITEASEQGKNPIVLVDGYLFARMTREMRAGLNGTHQTSAEGMNGLT